MFEISNVYSRHLPVPLRISNFPNENLTRQRWLETNLQWSFGDHKVKKIGILLADEHILVVCGHIYGRRSLYTSPLLFVVYFWSFTRPRLTTALQKTSFGKIINNEIENFFIRLLLENSRLFFHPFSLLAEKTNIYFPTTKIRITTTVTQFPHWHR